MGYRLRETESVSDGIRRISVEQFDRAIDRLSLRTRNKDRAIHTVRVCFKKLRAVLRLVQSEIGRDCFEFENIRYRDAGRLLAPARDTTVVALTLEELLTHFDKFPASDIKPLRKRLRQSKATPVIDMKQVLQAVAEIAVSARERVQYWPIESDGFSALRGGLQHVYKKGLNSFRRASIAQTTENLHEWRKQVKYLWYQLTILNPMWPKVLDAMTQELGKLANLLSDDHDLAMLHQTSIEQLSTIRELADLEELFLIINQRRNQLQLKALALGARVYAEEPKLFGNRLAAYWESLRPSESEETKESHQMLAYAEFDEAEEGYQALAYTASAH